jgi:protocatechuate 3,4-dioxygenase, alpha subunit
MTMTLRTPSQTIGPFFHVGLKWEEGQRVAFATTGEKITLTGRVYDGAGSPVSDALIETWQAGPDGKPPATGAGAKPHGYGRTATDADGRYAIDTVMPGAWSTSGGVSYAPQIHVTLFARGLLKAVRTRVVLGSPESARNDPLIKAAGARAATLIATRDPKSAATWRWDVRLQGADETAFIEL